MFNIQVSINLRNILEVREKEQLVSLETEALLEGDITNYQKPELYCSQEKLEY